MDRRYFLKGAGLAGLIAFLQACRLTGLEQLLSNGSTAIPTNTTVPLATFTPTSTLTPISGTTPSPNAPTGTHTPAPAAATSTPNALTTPTLTPTPMPTPYPPGPPSKLGLFITHYDPEIIELVAAGKPALVKTLELDANYIKSLKDSSPTTLMVGRLPFVQLNLDIDPQPLIQDYIDKMLPVATDPKRMDAFDAWEAYNEPIADTPDKMKRLAEFEAERTRILAENGIRSVVGNFATGHPPLELWEHFKPALDAIRQYNGYLGLHEYSAPVMQYMAGKVQPDGDPDQGDEGWLTLRYRKAYRNHLAPMGFADIPLLITECGVDGLVTQRPGPKDARGWKDFIDMWLTNGLRNDPPGVYMDQLIWYDENLQQDDYVQGAAIFTAGTRDEQWESYDIIGHDAGRMADLLLQYLEVHPPL